MSTLEIILLVILIMVVIGIAPLVRLYYRGGSNLVELEDELYPECECRGFVKGTAWKKKLKDAIEEAKPNWDKIKDVDDFLNQIR